MQNTAFTRSFSHTLAFCKRALPLLTMTLLLHCTLFTSSASTQDFKPQKFDQNLIADTLQDQEVLREEMLLEQEILREEMEQIRIEIQRIMKEIIEKFSLVIQKKFQSQLISTLVHRLDDMNTKYIKLKSNSQKN